MQFFKEILAIRMIIKKSRIKVSSKFLSCLFCICFAFLFCFPVSASAANYDIVNIDDIILVADNQDNKSALYGDRYGRYSYHQAFMMRVLLLSGADRDLITKDKLDTWESYVYKAYINSDELIVWEAVEKFMSSYVLVYFGDSDIRTKVAFSPRFISSVDFWLWIWNQQNGTAFDNPLVAVQDFNNMSWQGTGAYVVYSWNFLFNGETPDNFVIQPYSEWVEEKGDDLFWWFSFVGDAVDINMLTSWLPDVLSAPFISYWGFFMMLLTAFVALKVLHG